MNHHEAVEMIRGMNLKGDQSLAALPQSCEVVMGVQKTAHSILVAYTTRFGNEALNHLRTIRLVTEHGRWQLVSNVTVPMAAPITSRTGANLQGLPTNVPGVKISGWEDDPTRLGASVIPPLVTPAVEIERAAARAEVASRAHFAQVEARKQREAAERALRIARRRAILRRTPKGRSILRSEKAA